MGAGYGIAEKQARNAGMTGSDNSRENNFGIVRLMGAAFVFIGHMGAILGTEVPMLGGIPLQDMGVGILFLISGYLITKSWLSDPHPIRYAIRRFLRLWPPFAVMVLLIAFAAGPLLSSLGAEGYFETRGWLTFLKNLRFYIIYALPGVFTDLTIPNTTNGSMWTMPVEAALYIVTPLLLTAIRVKTHRKQSFYVMAVLTAAALAADTCFRYFRPDGRVVIYATNWTAAWHLIVLYLIGMLFTYEEARKLLNLQTGSVLMTVMLLQYLAATSAEQYLTMNLVFSYFILSLVFAPHPVFSRVGTKMDLSYGIYLYGFFFQQLTVYYTDVFDYPLTYRQSLLVSAVPTLIAAVLSHYLVERPCQRLSRFLTSRLRKKAG